MEEWDTIKKEEAEAKKKQEESLQMDSALSKCQGNDSKQWTNCKGTYITESGYKYVGKFKSGKILIGAATYPDGAKYFGQYKDGKRHGEGTLTYSDGRTYIGQFAAGLAYGEGLCINQDGSSVECKLLITESRDASTGKNRRSIAIEAKKWVKLSEYQSSSGKGKKIMDKLENNFRERAFELCSSTGNFIILRKRMEILEIDETPAFGLEPKIKMGVNGVVECK